MRKNISNKITIVFLLAVLFSCKAKKQIVMAAGAIKDTMKSAPTLNAAAAKLAEINAAQLNFNTFSGKAKTKLDINGSVNDVTLNIRITNGKKIWVSVTAVIGIEVARAVITPDSILVVNRLQAVYIKQPFSYIWMFTGNQVDYKTIESLLVGNAIPGTLNSNAQLQADNGNVNISGNMQDLLYKLVVAPNLKVSAMNLSNQAAGQSLQVNNSAFIQSGNRLIASQIDISSMVKGQKAQVNLHYNKVEFDQPQDYPFNIPSRYTPQN